MKISSEKSKIMTFCGNNVPRNICINSTVLGKGKSI